MNPENAGSKSRLRRLLQRLRYTLERFFVRGAQYRLLVVAALIGLISVTGGALVMLASGAFESFGEAVWWAFLRLTDPGYLGDDEGTWVRTVSTALTVTGYVVFLGALVAIMTQWLNSRMERLESGLTPVARNDHVLILGMTNRTPPMIRELLLSEERVRRFLRRHGADELHLVVLAEELDSALAQDLRDRVGEPWDEARVTLRSGSPLRVEHLQRVDYLNAASIVVPGDELRGKSAEAVDTENIKALLSLNASAGGAGTDEMPYAVAEIFDDRKRPVARRAYRGPLDVLASDATVSRLLAQNVRHPGLSLVYNEILSLGSGSEFYVRREHGCVGERFVDLGARFPDAILAGILRPESGDGFRSLINPDREVHVEEGDRLVLLAPNFGSTELVRDDPETASDRRGRNDDAGDGEESELPTSGRGGATVHRRILVLGWSHKVPALLREFGTYDNETYDVDVASVVPVEERRERISRTGPDSRSVKVTHRKLDYTLPDQLRSVEPAAYDSVMLVASDRLGSEEEADARTLLGLLLLQEMLPEDAGRPQTVAELHDPDNVPLLEPGLAEVIISPVLVSHMLAQVALRRELRPVFEDLFTAGGADLTFRTPAEYGVSGETLSFSRIEELAFSQGEMALGVLASPGPGRHEIELAPRRDRSFPLTEDRRIVVFHNY